MTYDRKLEIAVTVLRDTYVPLTMRSVPAIMMQKKTYSVFELCRPPKYVIANDGEEVSRKTRGRMELLRCIHVLDVLLECLLWNSQINPSIYPIEGNNSLGIESRTRAHGQHRSGPFRLEGTGNHRVE